MRTTLVIAALAACALQAQEKQIKKVPVEPTPMTSGSAMFKAYCAPCHGANGKGNGPAASALKKPPSDLTVLSKNHNGKLPDGYVAEKITKGDEPGHGSKDMP